VLALDHKPPTYFHIAKTISMFIMQFVEAEIWLTFSQNWLQTMVLLISASTVARIMHMCHHTYVFFEMGWWWFHYVAQASLKLMGSSDTPALVSQVAETTEVHFHIWLFLHNSKSKHLLIISSLNL
jgi:hypothetical protein